MGILDQSRPGSNSSGAIDKVYREDMIPRPWPRAILLDFYGTVVREAAGPIAEVCGRILDATPLRTGLDRVVDHWYERFIDLCNECHGPGFRTLKEIERLSLEETLERFKVQDDAGALVGGLYRYQARPEAFPEADAVLRQVQVPICIASNADESELLSAVEHIGLEVGHVVTSEAVRAYKPHRAVFREALDRLGMEPCDVLHVGDSFDCDVVGAKNAGMAVLWVNRKGRRRPHGGILPEYEFPDLRGLLQVLNGTGAPGGNTAWK